jgi:acetyl-CoA carboxylase carboxyl transferase subunit alpha
MFIGHQKGRNTKERQYRNFGMANPGRVSQSFKADETGRESLANPLLPLIDTPGALPWP